MNRNSIIVSMLIAFFVLSSISTTYAEQLNNVPKIEAPSAILIEVSRGQVLFKKNENQRLHISSASKIMTALLAMEKIKPDSKVTISKDALKIKGSILNLEAGEKYNAGDLVTAILLTPANDAASVLAEFISGDIKSFVGLMNAKAKELNMADTKFVNPTGLFDAMQYTSARDLSKLIQYALKNSEFNRLFSIKGQPFNSQILVSQNKLFWSYEGVDGGKAGYNEQEKQSAVTTATRGELRLAAIVLDSHSKSIWEDSKKLLDYGFNNFRTGILVNKDQVLKNVLLDDKEIGLVSLQDIYYTYPVGDSFVKKVDFDLPKELKPPVSKTEVLGKAIYVLNDGTGIDIALYSNTEIKVSRGILAYAVDRLKETEVLIYIIAILILAELIMVIYRIVQFIKRKSA